VGDRAGSASARGLRALDEPAVESVPVDTLTSEWPRVDLMKINVEGAEDDVWHGMQRTIT
jgi:hypothetical protein